MPPEDSIDATVAILSAVWATVLGAAIGSFLNVVIARLPAGESIVRPRSRCPRCGHAIAWYDNIPIASWFVLRARCRSCREPISARYPLVEAAMALTGLGAFLRHGLSATAFGELVFVALLLALALIDLDTWLLPHGLTAPLIAVGVLMALLGRGPTAVASLTGAAVGFGAFGAITLLGEKVLHRELMGLGDAFLLAGIGAWVGVQGLLPVVLLASVQGSVVGAVQLALGKARPGPPSAPAPEPPPAAAEAGPGSREAGDAEGPEDAWTPPRHAVPFGPFLAAGALEWLYLSSWLGTLFPALGAFR